MVNLYLNIFKHFIPNPEFWDGLKIVPIIMMANLFLGIYVNLSMWYKLSGQTMFGVWFSVIGAIITIVLNIIFIPLYGYMASAWTTLAAYFVMCMISYFVGRKYYPIPYNVRKIAILIFVSIGLSYVSQHIPFDNSVVRFLINTTLLGFFVIIIYNIDAQLREAVKAYKKKLWK